MSQPGIADIIFKYATGIIAITGFVIGLVQYRRAQNWKKAEIILGLIDSFKSDPEIQAACLMLDWDQREIQLEGRTMLSFRNEMLISGLRIIWMDADKRIPLDAVRSDATSERESDTGFTCDEALIRDCFDAFFDYFDKINAFRRSALVEWKDLSYFVYWLELVCKVGLNKSNPAIQDTVNQYLTVYDFRGFLELSKDYQRQSVALTGNSSTSSK
jgi:hypothetical protein